MPKPQLYLWPDRALVLGVAGDSQLHAHFAAQLSFGLHGPFQVRTSIDAPWQSTRAAFFAANGMHQVDSAGQPLAHVFIAASGQAALALRTELHADFHRTAAFAALLPSLQTLLHGKASINEANHILQQWLACALPSAWNTAQRSTDFRKNERMARIFAHIQQSMSATNGGGIRTPDAAELAALVHLSRSRFLHFFREQVGMSLARYLLWVRLQVAINAISQGANITSAAHQAGFADLAHMSRSFRATIGIAASSLQKIEIHAA